MSKGNTTWTYTYDANGMRTSRTNGTKTYNYVYNGSQLTQMTVGNDTLYFTYGAMGPATVTWEGYTYYYVLNGQGDVTAILDEDGIPVVWYNWNTAWGYNPEPEGLFADTLGVLNPLRYRGYVYDTETGYYYLQSRYYDPEIGRFINADSVIAGNGENILGYNMFAYCNNNPVLLIDPTGTFGISSILAALASVNPIGLAAAAVVVVVVATTGIVIYNANKRKPVNLPSWSKLKKDMNHILSGHTSGGSRNPRGNKSVFVGLTTAQIIRAMQEAYNVATKMQTQGNSVRLRGYSATFGVWIEFWVDLAEKIIKTAYPIP